MRKSLSIALLFLTLVINVFFATPVHAFGVGEVISEVRDSLIAGVGEVIDTILCKLFSLNCVPYNITLNTPPPPPISNDRNTYTYSDTNISSEPTQTPPRENITYSNDSNRASDYVTHITNTYPTTYITLAGGASTGGLTPEIENFVRDYVGKQADATSRSVSKVKKSVSSAGSGSVTSVAMTVPTGLSVSGSPITSTGTLALSLESGYNIPLTASTTEWNNKVSSQWTTAGSDIYYIGGKVGVGTIEPDAQFHVDSGVAGMRIGYGGSQNYFDADEQHFRLGNGTDVMMLAANGNVGIGTTSPVAKLALTGSGTGIGKAFVIADSSNVEKLSVTDAGTIGIAGDVNLASGARINFTGNYGSPENIWYLQDTLSPTGANYTTNRALVLNTFDSSNQGFMIRNNSNQSLFEVTGDGSSAYFAGTLYGNGGGLTNLIGSTDTVTSNMTAWSSSTSQMENVFDNNSVFFDASGYANRAKYGANSGNPVAVVSGGYVFDDNGNYANANFAYTAGSASYADTAGTANSMYGSTGNSGSNITAYSASYGATLDVFNNSNGYFFDSNGYANYANYAGYAYYGASGYGLAVNNGGGYIVDNGNTNNYLRVQNADYANYGSSGYEVAINYGGYVYGNSGSQLNAGYADSANNANYAYNSEYAGYAYYAGNANYASGYNLGDFFTGGGRNLDAGNNPLYGLSGGSETSPSLGFYNGNTNNTGLFVPTLDSLGFTTGGQEKMRIDSSGNVGIGTTNLTTRFQVGNQDNSGETNIRFDTSFSNPDLGLYYMNDPRVQLSTNGSSHGWGTPPVGAIRLGSGSSYGYISGSISGDHLLLQPTIGGNVGIGTAAPAYKLDVNGDINIQSGNALRYNGVVLARASTTLRNYFVGPSGNLTMTGDNNIGFGYGALQSNTTGIYNTAIGSSLNNNTTGSNNVGVGLSALAFNTTGEGNTAMGQGALFSNVTGDANTAIGKYALNKSTSQANTAIGGGALAVLTTGQSNTAIGTSAGVGYFEVNTQSFIDDNSTFIGAYASRDNTVATSTQLTNATAIGYRAKVGASNSLVLGGIGSEAVNVGIGTTTPASKLTVGSGQIGVALGSESLPSYSFNGDLNTGIYSPGADLLGLSTGGINRLSINNNGAVLIGSGAGGGAINAGLGGLDVSMGGSPVTLLLGAESNLTTRTNNTSKTFRIGGAPYSSAALPVGILIGFSNSNTNILSFGGGSTVVQAPTQIDFYTAVATNTPTGTSRMVIDNNGNVSINGGNLTVVGNAQFTAVGSAAAANDLRITADGTLTTNTSDGRLKTNLESLDGTTTLNKLLSLKPYSYNWIADPHGTKDIGLIAQDVAGVFPEITFVNRTDGYMGINYSRLPAIIIAAVKELSLRIEDVITRVTSIEHTIADLGNYFADKIVNIKEAVVGTLRVGDKVCVDDVCVTKEQFKTLLINAGAATVPIDSSSSSSGNNTEAQTATSTATSTDASEPVVTNEPEVVVPTPAPVESTPEPSTSEPAPEPTATE